jgi:hypothetical protein
MLSLGPSPSDVLIQQEKTIEMTGRLIAARESGIRPNLTLIVVRLQQKKKVLADAATPSLRLFYTVRIVKI